MTPELRERLQTMVGSHQVVLFMKGQRAQPQCGFSSQVVQILDRVVPDYQTYDVLADTEVRDGIKEFSDWPTIPQLYVAGEFQGGCDIVREMYGNGELHQALGVERATLAPPTLQITEAALAVLQPVQEEQGGLPLHLGIDALFRPSLGFGPEEPGFLTVEASGLLVVLDPESAARAEGVVIDAVETPGGPRLKIDNPNEPEAVEVGQLPVTELQRWREQGIEHQLLDVRPENERVVARIEGDLVLDAEGRSLVAGLAKETPLVFYCRSGQRSHAAAEYYARLGYTKVHNLAGGVNAWSAEVDPNVASY